MRRILGSVILGVAAVAGVLWWCLHPEVEHLEDVQYGSRHGDADTLTPLDQSTRFRASAATAGTGDVGLVVRKGRDHRPV